MNEVEKAVSALVGKNCASCIFFGSNFSERDKTYFVKSEKRELFKCFKHSNLEVTYLIEGFEVCGEHRERIRDNY